MKSVFVDTSAFYAAINRRDRHHEEAACLFELATAEQWRLITSNFVLAETHALILTRLGRRFATAWLRNVPAFIARISREDEHAGLQIILGHHDKAFSYCDATSFAIISRLKIRSAIAFDRHFRQFGKFELLGV